MPLAVESVPRVRRIVVAAKPDTEQSWVADAAAELAKQTGAELAVLSADGLELEALSTMPRTEYRNAAERGAQAVAERLRSHGLRPSVEIRSGPAVERILEFSEKFGAELILVGSSTRGAITSRLLGNVPLNLIQRSSRPVLVVTRPRDVP
jgi:nucleotide-binding universal stress UspA family protein